MLSHAEPFGAVTIEAWAYRRPIAVARGVTQAIASSVLARVPARRRRRGEIARRRGSSELHRRSEFALVGKCRICAPF